MIQLPVTQTGISRVKVTIDGVSYFIDYTFNSRNQRLYMSIFDKLGNPLLLGLRMLENLSPTNAYTTSQGLPTGGFTIGQLLDPEGSTATLGNTGIDQVFTLVYMSETELEQFDLTK